MLDDLSYTLVFGHSQAAIDYRRSRELQELSREKQELWQAQIPAATSLLEPEKDLLLWPHVGIDQGLWEWAHWHGKP